VRGLRLFFPQKGGGSQPLSSWEPVFWPKNGLLYSNSKKGNRAPLQGAYLNHTSPSDAAIVLVSPYVIVRLSVWEMAMHTNIPSGFPGNKNKIFSGPGGVAPWIAIDDNDISINDGISEVVLSCPDMVSGWNYIKISNDGGGVLSVEVNEESQGIVPIAQDMGVIEIASSYAGGLGAIEIKNGG
jgi:hypothetical protein